MEQFFSPKDWQYQSYNAFQTAITSLDPVEFPCIYATKGLKAQEHRFIFLDSEDLCESKNLSTLATGLQQYLETPHSELGPTTSLVVLTPITNSSLNVEDYYQMFWSCLRGLRQRDPKPWPKQMTKYTETPPWRFCFNGEPVFSAVMTPAHEKRRSRYTECLCIAFQPDFVFDLLFATKAKRASAESKVRGLMSEFDNVSISPELLDYDEETSRESKQYFMMDENYSLPCPFKTLD